MLKKLTNNFRVEQLLFSSLNFAFEIACRHSGVIKAGRVVATLKAIYIGASRGSNGQSLIKIRTKFDFMKALSHRFYLEQEGKQCLTFPL